MSSQPSLWLRATARDREIPPICRVNLVLEAYIRRRNASTMSSPLDEDASARAATWLGLRCVLGDRPRGEAVVVGVDDGRRMVIRRRCSGRRPDTDGRVQLRRRADLARNRSEGRAMNGTLRKDRKLNLCTRRTLFPFGCLVFVLGHRHDRVDALLLHVGTYEGLLTVH